jgi:CheY-like chemotaxis protein
MELEQAPSGIPNRWKVWKNGESDQITELTHDSLDSEKPVISSFKGSHILVAEDNATNQFIITQFLESFGCHVTMASNGKDILDKIHEKSYDLILMDCQMPVMDGFEASRAIVNLEKSGKIKNIPIVALTANAIKGDREKCLAAGMSDYLSKPIHKADLEKALIKWVK